MGFTYRAYVPSLADHWHMSDFRYQHQVLLVSATGFDLRKVNTRRGERVTGRFTIHCLYGDFDVRKYKRRR